MKWISSDLVLVVRGGSYNLKRFQSGDEDRRGFVVRGEDKTRAMEKDEKKEKTQGEQKQGRASTGMIESYKQMRYIPGNKEIDPRVAGPERERDK